jgi:hypothetical protein
MALRADLEALRESMERCDQQLEELEYASKPSQLSAEHDILTDDLPF